MCIDSISALGGGSGCVETTQLLSLQIFPSQTSIPSCLCCQLVTIVNDTDSHTGVRCLLFPPYVHTNTSPCRIKFVLGNEVGYFESIYRKVFRSVCGGLFLVHFYFRLAVTFNKKLKHFNTLAGCHVAFSDVDIMTKDEPNHFQ